MIIRTKHFDSLAAAHFEQLIRRLCEGLRNQFPVETKRLPPKELETRTRRSVEVCKRYEIGVEQDIRRFAEFALLYGPGFDRELSWASQILNQQGISGNERIRQLDEYELFALGGGPR